MASPGVLTLTQLVKAVRQDLQDLDATNYRWSDDSLKREIDRAVDRYSHVAPLLGTAQIATIANSRLYALPSGSWWVERVEYPMGFWPKIFVPFTERSSPAIAAPSVAPTIGASAGPLTGNYKYALTFTVPGGGETPAGPQTTTQVFSSQAGQLSGIPTGPYGVTGRNLYRTAAGGSQLKLLATIADNTTTTYTDTVLDGALGVNVQTSNTSGGIPQFELLLDAARLPADATGLLEVWTASKHELDAAGTTIPEKHWDAIALGAQAYSLYAYLTTTNDNLDYVDGQFRDRVDDTNAPDAWRKHAAEIMQLFNVRLRQIENEMNARTPVTAAQWGDKPSRWDRL